MQLSGLDVQRGKTIVLKDFSLRLQRGRLIGLVGPSGCGKTTLIRAIAGVQKTRSGQVRVLGSPAGSTRNRRRVGYVTQASSVYPDLTVNENLTYFAAVSGSGPDQIAAAMDTVKLTASRSQLVGALSGGQRARVSLAAALVGQYELFLFDEPTVGLDPVLRQELWSTFDNLARSGCTLLISSHVMDEAARCHEVLLMRDGALLAQQSPHHLLQHTGTQDLEAAFLTLAESAAESAPGAA